MHLDPEDLVRPHRPAGGAPSAITAPTEPHPRVSRPRPRLDDAQTRLSLADLAPPAPTAVTPASVVAAALDEQARLNAAHSRRMDAIVRRGPGGVFGWRPAAGPSLAEVAAARRKVAEDEERRRTAHQRHMDVLEMVRAYLGIIALVLLVLFVGAAAMLALGIMSGYYTWAPVHH